MQVLNYSTNLRINFFFFITTRFLAKLKAGYQISKLFAISAFDTWIAQILNFTTQSFQIYQWSSNSAFFLLSFWSRSINSLFHLKDEERLSLMEQYIPKVNKNLQSFWKLKKKKKFLKGFDFFH